MMVGAAAEAARGRGSGRRARAAARAEGAVAIIMQLLLLRRVSEGAPRLAALRTSWRMCVLGVCVDCLVVERRGRDGAGVAPTVPLSLCSLCSLCSKSRAYGWMATERVAMCAVRWSE